jgi:hypothetical protein
MYHNRFDNHYGDKDAMDRRDIDALLGSTNRQHDDNDNDPDNNNRDNGDDDNLDDGLSADKAYFYN